MPPSPVLLFAATLALGAHGADLNSAAATEATHAATLPATNGSSLSTSTSAPGGRPAGTGFTLDDFRLISDRNIFNPSRSGRSPERETTRREPERRVRTESISLVGTLSYDKGDFAFFDGSSPDFRRALKPDESIAGLTLTSISPSQVVLRTAALSAGAIPAADPSTAGATNGTTGTLTLPVGRQLRRLDDGPWELSDRIETPTATAMGSSSSSAAGAGGSDDVLKRLMQLREQESGGASPAPGATPGGGVGAAGAASPASPAPANPGSGSGSPEDEILKRLMQRREKGE